MYSRKRKYRKNLIFNKNDFYPQIIERGKEYFKQNKILHCFKKGNLFLATVLGSNDEHYKVKIEVKNNKIMSYYCTCPCEFPCKHIYATIMTINNHRYIEPKLKREIKCQYFDFKKILEHIPAKELKQYLINDNYFYLLYNNSFRSEFINYFPKNKYEYYYNKLYNLYLLKEDTCNEIDLFQEYIKDYLKAKNYRQAFVIIKAIIESTYDTFNLNENDDIVNLLLKLGMYLRIVYRKANDKLKEENINPWLDKIKNNNYYDNLYLEDIILSIYCIDKIS